MVQDGTSAAGAKAKVFLSYSRTDAGFLDRLQAALAERGFAPIFDRSQRPHDDPDLQLTAEDEWWRQLQTMIAASDVMVFVVSPDSAASRICDDEIAYAKGLGKRVIAILRRETDFKRAPERLRGLNVKLDFKGDDARDFDEAVAALTSQLDQNVLWRRRGAHFARLAQKWESEGRPEAQLLRAGAVDDADSWAAHRPGAEPEPGPILLAFLDASRTKEQRDNNVRRRLIQRGFVAPVDMALQAGRDEAALRLMAAGGVLSDDVNFSLEEETQEPHRFALWRAGLRAIRHPCLASLHVPGAVVTHVAFSRDGRRVLTVSRGPSFEFHENIARVWNAETGSEIAVMRGHERYICGAEFSSDATRVLTGSDDLTARIWDAASGTQIAICRGHQREIRCVAFSPDGTRVLTGSRDRTARLWNAASGAQIALLQGHEDSITSVAFNPDGTRALTTGDLSPLMWDVAAGAKIGVLSGHKGPVMCSAFSRDGARAVTGAEGAFDQTARVWDVRTCREIAILSGHKPGVKHVAFSPDGKRVLTIGPAGAAHAWDASSGAEILALRSQHRGASAAFSPDGSRVLTDSEDRTARLYDAATSAEIAVLRGHEHGVTSVAFSPDGTRALTGSYDGAARLWDLAPGATIFVRRVERTRSDIAFSEDWARALIGGARRLGDKFDGAVMWDVSTDAQIGMLPDSSGVNCVALSRDGRWALTGSIDKTARVWNLNTGAEVSVLRGHEASISSVAFNSDGTQALTGSYDKTARVWDAALGTQICVLRGHRELLKRVAFSPCGGLAIGGGGENAIVGERDFTVRLWNARSGAELALLSSHEGAINDVAISQDGGRALSASSDGTVRIWDVATGAEIVVLRGHERDVLRAAFSPNGAHVLTGGQDRTVRLWDAATGAEMLVLRGHENETRVDAFDQIGFVAFSPDGRRALSVATGGQMREWDIARSSAFTTHRGVFLAAALDCGVGRLSGEEKSDLLMQDAPDDLFVAVMQRLTPEEQAQAQEASRALRAPMHPNCYLPAGGFAE